MITKSSYGLTIDNDPLILSIVKVIFIIIIITSSIFLYLKLKWRSKRILVNNFGYATIQRLRSMDSFTYDTHEITQFFDHFISDFLFKSFLGGDIVVQVTGDNKLLGLGFYNREADLGTIFTNDNNIKREIQKYLKCHDFFTEVRESSNVAKSITSQSSYSGSTRNIFGLIDIYQILSLKLETSYTFDTQLIHEMKNEDLPEIIIISEQVNGIKSKIWIKSQFESGDIGIIAFVNNQIVGFAFASISGTFGRLHTLTVSPNFRNRGIGKELMKARLKILYDLGITTVITEIANWNLPSLQIAYSHGFTKIGELFIETNRSVPRKKNLMRI